MNNVDNQYLTILRDIIENGYEKDSRAGKVKSLFGKQMSFSLKDGFPLLTTKKMFTKGVIYELLYFLNGKCSIEYLSDNNVHIWDCDCKRWDKESESLLGNIYPHQWRHWGADEVKIYVDTKPFSIKVNELIESDSPLIKSESGDYRIIEILEKGFVKIQFIETGYIDKVKKDKAKKGDVVDPYIPHLYGICAKGVYDTKNKVYKKAYAFWHELVSLCYNVHDKNYKYNGLCGFRLSKDWKCFEYFLRDIQTLQNWDKKAINWNRYKLNKDIFNKSFIYGKDTCAWTYITDNNSKRHKEKFEYTVTNGKRCETFVDEYSFMQLESIKNPRVFISMLREEIDKWEGWSLISKKIIKNEGIDQISNIIETLKNDPDNRRIILSAWNVSDLDKMALHPCHIFAQFYTRDLTSIERWELYKKKFGEVNEQIEHILDNNGIPIKELSCMFFCRSQDFPLGTPFNIASYALLTHMIAHCVNMGVGNLIWNGGSCDVYLNQIESIQEQLNRDPNKYDLPKLVLNPECKDINDFTFDDINIVDYESYPAIKTPLSVGI